MASAIVLIVIAIKRLIPGQYCCIVFCVCCKQRFYIFAISVSMPKVAVDSSQFEAPRCCCHFTDDSTPCPDVQCLCGQKLLPLFWPFPCGIRCYSSRIRHVPSTALRHLCNLLKLISLMNPANIPSFVAFSEIIFLIRMLAINNDIIKPVFYEWIPKLQNVYFTQFSLI